MNWEYVGWLALLVSALVIVAGFFVKPKEAVAADGTKAETDLHPLHAWLEIAWPVLFIATMGMLTLKEVMGFAAVLLTATVVTGIIWGIDTALLRKKRGAAAEPVVVEMARSFFPVILIVFLLRSFLYEPFKIPSESMLPTLQVGDFILVNKYTYGVRLPVLNQKVIEGGSPKRGDVMVFRYPEDPAKDFIKRVIGLPGDKLAYKNKRLTLNGKPVDTQSVGMEQKVDPSLNLRRFESLKETIDGRTHAIQMDPEAPGVRLSGVRRFPNISNCEYNNDGVECTVPDGHYFMMGDNRDNSDDSRYWGFVPDRNIVGRAVLIWMNFGSFKRIGMSIE